MDDLKESQKMVHVTRLPLNDFKVRLRSFAEMVRDLKGLKLPAEAGCGNIERA